MLNVPELTHYLVSVNRIEFACLFPIFGRYVYLAKKDKVSVQGPVVYEIEVYIKRKL